MSRHDDNGIEPPRQPREWFAVLFGNRLLGNERAHINSFTESVAGICAEEGLLLCNRPFCNLIFEEEDGDRLVDDISRTIEDIKKKYEPHEHLPLVLVVDDQTMVALYDDVLEPVFKGDALLFAHKAKRVREMMAVNSWTEVRNDVRSIRDLLDEYNPLIHPRPNHYPRDNRSARDDYGDDRSARDDYGNGGAWRGDDRYDDYGSGRRAADQYDDYGDRRTNRYEDENTNYRHRADRFDEPRPAKKRLTMDTINGALTNVRHNPNLLPYLAEDMNNNVDLSDLALPQSRDDLMSLLKLLVLTTEHSPEYEDEQKMERDRAWDLRKRITSKIVGVRILPEVYDEFVRHVPDSIRDDDITDNELRSSATAADLILRAMAKIKTYRTSRDEVVSLFAELEILLFGLPARFWNVIYDEQFEDMCKNASIITENEPQLYRDMVIDAKARAREERERQARAEQQQPQREAYGAARESEQPRGYHDRPEDGYSRRDEGRGADEASGAAALPSRSQYKHDPYEWNSETDESDTTEVYPSRHDEPPAPSSTEYGRRDEEQAGYGNGQRREENYDGYGEDWREEERAYERPQNGRREEDWRREERDNYDGRRGREEEYENERRREEKRGGGLSAEERIRLREEQEAEEERDRVAQAEALREFELRKAEHAIQLMEQREAHKKWVDGEIRPIVDWDACEMREPPSSFRKLSIRACYQELASPTPQYLRRALVDGVYTDNEHYLDVMFRLMREDLVSPLRDGIYHQKMLAGDNRNITSGNDFKVYPMIEVGALQIRSMNGQPTRIVNIPQSLLQDIREDKNLKFGQCVVLSSDNFTREFHIGWISDRFQQNGMPWTGRLGITLFDECTPRRRGATPINKNSTYAMVESPSYLEAYWHVLQVMKKMRRFVPFPLERYLVSLKKNTRLPQFMRAVEKEEDQEEDKQRQLMYTKMMAEEEQKKKEKAKKKAERTHRSNSAESTEGEITTMEGVTTDEGAHSGDDGFNTDEEDAFLTGRGRRFVHPNPKDLERLTIRGRPYNVEKLEDEFTCDYLDETQRKALCYALTSELAIIQGPPGTGKTHLGVEIVMSILENRIKWRITEPILIVTFSNQALDHFLEKILARLEHFEHNDAPKIVRIGSRSENEEMLKHLMLPVVREHEENLGATVNQERRKQEQGMKRQAQQKLMRAVKTVQTSRTNVMAFNFLKTAMSREHTEQMRRLSIGRQDSSGNPLNMDETLVCWLLDKDYARRRDLPPREGGGGGESDEDEYGMRVEPEEQRSFTGGAVAERRVEKKPKKKKEGGRETKKEENERKRREKRDQWRNGEDSSDEEDNDDDEEEDESEGPLAANSNEEEDEDEEARIRSLLEKVNMRASEQRTTSEQDEKWRNLAEKYEMDAMWEMEKEMMQKGKTGIDDVEIFSRTMKDPLRRGKNVQPISVDMSIVRDINEQKQYILAKEGLSREEAATIKDISTLPKERRWRLLVLWQETLARAMRESLDPSCAQYEAACARYERAADDVRADVLKKALVIGATTTGSAKRRRLMAKIAPRVLIVEEAAEVLEAHLLASIVPSVQQAIFIGDHQQLRPSTAVHHLAKEANMEVSLFERLVKNGYPFHTLGLQHRMLTPLTQHVVRPFFYNKLQDAPSVHNYPDVKGMATNLFFWAHSVPEDTPPDSMSKRNKTEAEMCRNLANYIYLQGQYSVKEITIIGMYGAQVVEIRRQLQMAASRVSDVAVETVDSFQGKENRVMILSLVRSQGGGVGFLAVANRITVALTRAQHAMYVIGNFQDISYFSTLWSNIVDSLNNAGLIDYNLPVICQRHGHHTALRICTDFRTLVPMGGCLEVCGFEMACGHACKEVCHPPDQHTRAELLQLQLSDGSGRPVEGPDIRCKEKCLKRCEKCQAQCSKLCQETCGSCHAIVMLELDCGHSVRTACGQRQLAKCKEPCSEVLECGHLCQRRCSSPCLSMAECEYSVQYTHPACLHVLQLPCNKINRLLGITEVPPCYEKCPETLVCGHKCPRNCGESCPAFCETIVNFEHPTCGHKNSKKCSDDKRHVKCTTRVRSAFPNCSHDIEMECHLSRDQNACRSVCKKPTSCGHTCSLSCGDCFKKASSHECDAPCRKLQPCGHHCDGRCSKPCKCLNGCRTRCSHLRCGSMARKEKGGEVSFGRSCGAECVLCPEACDNHCEHRSCSKKCYEACDVTPCNQPCTKQLRCGHGCLGLCGDACPPVCGTCSITSYKSLLEQYKDEGEELQQPQQLTRLIELPDCKHVFPYRYMDREVKAQLEGGAVAIKCPRCKGFVDGARRYMRQQKRLWLETDTRKWEKRMAEEEMSKAEIMQKYREMGRLMTGYYDQVMQFSATVHGKRGGGGGPLNLPAEMVNGAQLLYSALKMELDRAEERREFYYWNAVVDCYRSISALTLDYLHDAALFKMQPLLESLPNLRQVIFESFEFKQSRAYRIRDGFKEAVSLVQQSLLDRRVGALVPFFRTAMIKCHLHFHMERLQAEMRRGNGADLPMEMGQSMRRVIKSIRMDAPSDFPDVKLDDMMKRVKSDVYTRLLNMEGPLVTYRVPLPNF